MNWGKGLALFFGGFILFMGGLVTVCMMQEDLHLVTQNYYEEEIKYQEQIDRTVNANSLDYKVITFHAKKKSLSLDLPLGAVGTLQLFRPSDARLDQKISIEMIHPTLSIDLRDLKPGYWKMMLTWEAGDKEFYKEENITL